MTPPRFVVQRRIDLPAAVFDTKEEAVETAKEVVRQGGGVWAVLELVAEVESEGFIVRELGKREPIREWTGSETKIWDLAAEGLGRQSVESVNPPFRHVPKDSIAGAPDLAAADTFKPPTSR